MVEVSRQESVASSVEAPSPPRPINVARLSGVWLGSPPSSYVAKGRILTGPARSPSPQRQRCKTNDSAQLLSAEARERVSRDLAAVEEQLARVARASAASAEDISLARQMTVELDRSALLFQRLKDESGTPGAISRMRGSNLENFVTTPGGTRSSSPSRGQVCSLPATALFQTSTVSGSPRAISRMSSTNLENFVTTPGRSARSSSPSRGQVHPLPASVPFQTSTVSGSPRAISRMSSTNLENFVTTPGRSARSSSPSRGQVYALPASVAFQTSTVSGSPRAISRMSSTNLENFVTTPGRDARSSSPSRGQVSPLPSTVPFLTSTLPGSPRAISRVGSVNLENFVTTPGRVGRSLSRDRAPPHSSTVPFPAVVRSPSRGRKERSAVEVAYEALRSRDCSVKALPSFVATSQVYGTCSKPAQSLVAVPLPNCGVEPGGSVTLPRAMSPSPPPPTKYSFSNSTPQPSAPFPSSVGFPSKIGRSPSSNSLDIAKGDSQLAGVAVGLFKKPSFPIPGTVAKPEGMNLAQNAAQLFAAVSKAAKDFAQIPASTPGSSKFSAPGCAVPAPIPVQRRFSHKSNCSSRDLSDKGSFARGDSVRLQGVVSSPAPAAKLVAAPTVIPVASPIATPVAAPCASPVPRPPSTSPTPANRGFPPGQTTSQGLVSSSSNSLSSAARAVCSANAVVQASCRLPACNPVSNLSRSSSVHSRRDRAAPSSTGMSFVPSAGHSRPRSTSPLPRTMPSPQQFVMPRSESRGKLPGLLGTSNLGKIFADSFHEGKFNFYNAAGGSQDPLDESFSRCVRRLGLSEQILGVKRLGVGRYEIDGRRVKLRWKDADQSEVLAVEEDVPDPADRETPLSVYMNQAARVAQFRVDQGVSQLQSRPSFGNIVGAPSTANFNEDDRVSSMNLACQQARLRAWSIGSSFT